MAGYQDLHRYFLQNLVAHKMMIQRDAHQLYQRSCDKYGVQHDAQDFPPLINIINKKLKPLYMEIRQGKSEDDGKLYYALVNSCEDEHSKMATDFTPNEIAFFKKILELIVLSDDGHQPAMTLINIGTELDIKITAGAAEALLERLAVEKWLTEIDGDCSLGPRTIIELSMYLKQIYQEEIPDCKLCMNIVVKGQTCANCGIRIHLYCSSRLFKGRDPGARKCPGCEANWHHEIPHIIEQVSNAEIRNPAAEQSTSSLLEDRSHSSRTRSRRSTRN